MADIKGIGSAAILKFCKTKIVYCTILLPSNLFFNSLYCEKQYYYSSFSAFFGTLYPTINTPGIGGSGEKPHGSSGQCGWGFCLGL